MDSDHPFVVPECTDTRPVRSTTSKNMTDGSFSPLVTVNLAVLIPCYNEESTIAEVVQGFTAALPGAVCYVYDNNSGDRTVERARAAGAIVRRETSQGKGNVVRRMFADISADVYVLVDGDATYDSEAAGRAVAVLLEGPYDMVNVSRVTAVESAYRPGHAFGNRMLTGIVSLLFGRQVTDMLSGYRVLSRRFVKSFPALSQGFEIETELTVHALELRMPVSEIPAPYYARPEGSMSKLSTYGDGFRILITIIKLFKEERPLTFFGMLSGLFALVGLGLFGPLLADYLATGLVPRLPTAVLSASLMILAALSLTCGLILDTVTRGRKEAKRMRYLSYAPPSRE